VFAGHRIEAVAGRGGMGVVYRAIQLDLDRTVALKLIATQLALDDEFRGRFVAESRAAAAIDHPNVIPIYYTGEEGGQLYIVMRYVDGDDLRTVSRREAGLAPARAAHIVSQVAAALDAAHARGIVHRDVKPANVLLSTGDHVYLTDFGLTKRVASATGATRTGGWVGTLGYVAPEQIRGERVDARTDVYALGCVLFHALTGATPYHRDSDEATLWAHLHEPPPPVTALAPGVPREFEDVIARALQKEPGARHPSAGDLGRAALAAAGRPQARTPERQVATGAAAPVDQPTVTARSQLATRPVPARRRPPSRRVAVLAAGLLAGAAAVAAAAALVSGDGGGSPGPSSPGKPLGPTARVAATMNISRRGSDLAYADGRVWVIAFKSSSVIALDADAGRPVDRISLPPAAAAITAGFGSLWVVNGASQTVTRIPIGARRPRPPIQLPPGRAAAVAAGEGAVWTGSRTGHLNPFLVQHVVGIDPKDGSVRASFSLPNGVQDLAVGYGAVWVLNRSKQIVTRIDPATQQRVNVRVGADPQRIAVGAGYVWVTNGADDTVTRIRPRALDTATIPVGNGPVGIGVGGGAVWVANNLDSTLTRIDPRRARKIGEDVEVGTNPSAVLVHGGRVWVTTIGDRGLTRVDFR
jgi:predicted Ser/Thr protein kinase